MLDALAGALKAALVIMAFAGMMWPPFFAFVLEARARKWLAGRMNDRIYRSGRGAHWKTTSGRSVGHIQFAFMFGPTFLWIGVIVLLAILLRKAGIDVR